MKFLPRRFHAFAAILFYTLLSLTGTLRGAILLRYNFDSGNPWTAMTGYFQSAGGTGTATPTVTTVGTVNSYGAASNLDVNNIASGGLKLVVDSSSATGTWTAGVNSGVLSLLTTNTITNPGLLTLGFSLWSSRANPILVRLESYDSTGSTRTGGLKTLIYPAAPNFYQRFALDLSTMTADGAGTFVANNNSKIKIYFEIGNALGGEGWPNVAGLELHVDNINYSTPKYYVKPSTPGSDSNDGLTDATPWKTISKAVNAAVAGDIIALMGSESDQFVASGTSGLAGFGKPGAPDAWIVLKNYPGQRPVLMSAGWNTIFIGLGSSGNRYTASTVPAYIEIRGLTVRGYSSFDANGDRQLAAAYKSYIGLPDSRSNSNGIGIDGRYSDYFMHDFRIADNIVEYCSAAGIGAGVVDRVTFENNIVRYNTWWSIYGGSGISLGVSVATENNTDTRMLIQGNQCYGNEGMIPWRVVNGFSDGNGIIVDTNQISYTSNTFNVPNYTGRTLVQNNLSYNNGGSGIHAFQSAHVDIIHNVAYHNSASPRLTYAQMFAAYSSDVRMINNILVAPNNPTGNTSFNEPITTNNSNTNGTIYYQNNVFYGEGNNQTIPTNANFTNNTTTNPLFLSASTDPASNDFHLRPTSPALNNGLAIAYRSAIDFAGRPRLTTNTTPDRGAYQTQSGDIYAPIFSPQPGNFSSAQSVTLASDTAGAKIVYTTNGTTPTVDGSGNATNGTVYTGTAIPVGTATTTLQAISWKSGSPTSYVSNAVYTFSPTAVAIPDLTFDVWPLTDDGTRYVSVICNTPGAWVRYTLDGTTPSPTNGTIAPAAAIQVTAGNIIKAIAYTTGRANSNVLTGNFVVRGFVGNGTEGTTTVAIGANKIRFVRFNTAKTLTVTRIYAKVGAITGNYRTAIYADNSGAPGALQRYSTVAATNPAAGWQSFTLNSALALTPTDSKGNVLYYWLAIWSDSASASIYTATSGGTVRESTSTFSSTWPATAPTSAAAATGPAYAYSIFATSAYRPVISAGANQTIVGTGSAATLTGTATDNSTLPVPLTSGSLTTTWTKVSGPGTVTFANSAALATTATFSATGSYVLRLTAQETVFTSFAPVTSDVTITVGTPLTPTATTLVSSVNPAYLGGSVTFTANVSSGSGTPAGTVTFYDGTNSLGTGTLVSGTATLSTSALPAGTRVVTAVYAGNSTYATSTSLAVNQAMLRPDGTLRQLAINAAGPDLPGTGFVADTGFTGGAVTTTTNTINLTGATNPAPQSVYQSERYGTALSYTLGGFVPSDAYLVRLHFSENWFGIAGRGGVANTVGQRLFNISINGTQRLTGFDIYAAAGAPNKAVVREFVATADPSGQLTIAFAATLNSVAIDGLEVYTASTVDAWRADNFTPAQLDNAAVSGPTADADGDGVSNLLELALGSDPLDPSSAALPVVGRDANGALTLTFMRASDGITYIVESSSDLQTWQTVATNPGNVGDTVTVSDPASINQPRRFLRLRVTAP